MSLALREALGYTTLACILWDTVLTFILLRKAIDNSRRIAALEEVQGVSTPNESDGSGHC